MTRAQIGNRQAIGQPDAAPHRRVNIPSSNFSRSNSVGPVSVKVVAA
ncbi:MAG: hypothetical protein QOD93_837 [Acetobacteraceae bacterium]|jgi:hypothetical protein|nr:hypothetical protein [Acetobacteraceae bacterium]MEA2767875.1 hypothetical protein [Acetobacteraceae bacterium]